MNSKSCLFALRVTPFVRWFGPGVLALYVGVGCASNNAEQPSVGTEASSAASSNAVSSGGVSSTVTSATSTVAASSSSAAASTTDPDRTATSSAVTSEPTPAATGTEAMETNATSDSLVQTSSNSDATTAHTSGNADVGTTGVTSSADATTAPSGEPGVRVIGRTEPGTAGSVKFAWPGVHFVARFTGTQVSARLKDGSNANRFTVVIDDQAPKTITTTNQETISLATGLVQGEHQVVLWRNTESYKGTTEFVEFTDFGDGGRLLAPPAAPERRIEMVGDSITVGSGVEGPTRECTQDDYTNNYLAYGSIAARILEADVVTTAYSGIGVYRGYKADGAAEPPTMAARFGHTLTEQQTAWDFANYTPHVVVINLGTNDASRGDTGAPYAQAYVELASSVHATYPAAKLLLVRFSTSWQLEPVVEALSADGADIEVMDYIASGDNPLDTACYHPDEAAHQRLGEALADELQTLMGW